MTTQVILFARTPFQTLVSVVLVVPSLAVTGEARTPFIAAICLSMIVATVSPITTL